MGRAHTDLEVFRLPDAQARATNTPKRQKKRRRGRFLKGPVPWGWLVTAGAIKNPSVLKVSMILWHRRGITGEPVTVPKRNRAEWGLSRSMVMRALRELEAVNLIQVKRQRGRRALVTLLDVPDCPPDRVE